MPSDLTLRLALLLGLMAALALLEAWLPLRLQRRSWTSRRPNLLLTAVFFAMNLALTVGMVGIAARIEAAHFGVLAWASVPPFPAFVLGVLALDLAAYCAHVLMHKLPFLWRFHRVHHSDETVDVTTAYRQHPVETLVRFGFTAGPAVLLGVGATATATYRLLSGINALLEHANIRVAPAVTRCLGRIVVTPDMHKVHHSCVARETDSNYGNIVPWFDQLFATYVSSERAAAVTYGLDLRGTQHRSFVGLLKLPWLRADVHVAITACEAAPGRERA